MNAVLECGHFDEILIGLDAAPNDPLPISSRALIRLSTWLPSEHGELLRRLWRRALDEPPLPGSSLVLHHHAGLLFRHRGHPWYYVHTPTRVLWEKALVPWEVSVAAEMADELRTRELESIGRAEEVMVPSLFVAARFEHAYGRRPMVLRPPVDSWQGGVRACPDARLGRRNVLCISRLAPAKSLELLLLAAERLPDVAVLIVGEGRLAGELSASAPPNVQLLGRRGDDEIRWLAQQSLVGIAPAVEDFGLASRELVCLGLPCVVPDYGGQLEEMDESWIVEFPAQGAARDLAEAIERALDVPLSRGAAESCRARFGASAFAAGLARALGDAKW